MTNANRMVIIVPFSNLLGASNWHQIARERLDAWAKDRILAAEQALQDTKLKLKALKRQARTAMSMDEARRLQQETRKVEAEQRRQRQAILEVEDDIQAKHDALIATLEKRLHQASNFRELFTIRWSIG